MSSVQTYNQSIIDELIGWIAQQQDKSLTTATVAARAGFSQWHMQRVFKQHTGVPLGKYIKDIRLGKAVLELIQGRETVIIIAVKFGYESQQTFTRAIKNHTGLNPGEIKRLPDAQKLRLKNTILNLHHEHVERRL